MSTTIWDRMANYLGRCSNHYFSEPHKWGTAINFDGENSAPVRDFFLANVAHLDFQQLPPTLVIAMYPENFVQLISNLVRNAVEALYFLDTIPQYDFVQNHGDIYVIPFAVEKER